MIVFVVNQCVNDELKASVGVAVKGSREQQKHVFVVTDIIGMTFLSIK